MQHATSAFETLSVAEIGLFFLYKKLSIIWKDISYLFDNTKQSSQ